MAYKSIFGAVGVCLVVASLNTSATPSYSLVTPGFYDAEHTRIDGYQSSYALRLNQAGQVAGGSERFGGPYGFSAGNSAWLYDGSHTLKLGLTGAEHTSNDGYQASYVYDLNQAGQVAGTSFRFNGMEASVGSSVWLYDGSSTRNIGLTGVEHTSNLGWQFNEFRYLNQAGQVAGWATRYNGTGTSLGLSAWLYNGISTLNIGLTNAEHTRIDGYQSSESHGYNEAGQVTGNASRYSATGASLGSSAWLYDGSSTQKIGLTGADHSRNDGYQNNSIGSLNQAGQVTGSAERYSAMGASLGTSAWLYDGSSAQDIGLTDVEHTRNDGYKYSSDKALNEAGQVAGRSNRYSATGTSLGTSAWLYNGSSTQGIGLTDIEHTSPLGRQSNDIYYLNQAGQVAGRADRYSATGTNLGESAWLYDGNGTQKIGLIGAEHTRDDGFQKNYIQVLNESGQVAGNASRYDGASTYLGQSAWLYDGSSTQDIGLTGAVHTRDDGFQNNYIGSLNESGQVTGYAERFGGSDTDLGQSAWFYDDATGMTYFNDFSIRLSDGYAASYEQYLGVDGLMLGYYELFDDLDSSFLGNRAFGFTVENGFFDLGLQIEGGLELFGWDNLANVYYANGSGQIIGTGLLDGMTGKQAVYLATPSTVPVPAAVWLFGSGLIGLIAVARRKV